MTKYIIQLKVFKGYIKFYIDRFKDKNIKDIENKKFVDLPTKLDSKITMIEIFDTKDFINFIDSDVIVEFKNIISHKIETKINISYDKINIEYQGLIDIK